MKFIFFLKYCKFSHFEKKKISDAAAKSDARGDEKHFYFFTWPKSPPLPSKTGNRYDQAKK